MLLFQVILALVVRIARPMSLAIVGSLIADQTATGDQIAINSHRYVKTNAYFSDPGQHLRIFAGAVLGAK